MNVGTIEAVLRLRDEMTAQLNKAAKSLEDLGEQATKAGMTMSAGFTLPIVAAGTASVMAFSGFERVMNQVAAVSTDGEANFEGLKAAALEWGAKTQFSAKEAGDALFELSKAGLTSIQAIDALGPTLELATAAEMSLADAASLSANVMDTFNLKAEDMSHANDIMARAAASATLDVTDLRETLKYVGPLAQGAGKDLAFVSAGASMLAGAGVKASQAGTTLKGALGDLLNPIGQTVGGLEKLGYTTQQIKSGQIELTDVLNRLNGRTDAAALAMQTFGTFAGPGMIELAKQGGDALNKLAEEFRNTDGDAKRMADATMKGLGGAMETMAGGIETAGIALGEVLAPAVTAVAGQIAKLADWMTNTVIPAFKNLPGPVQKIIGALVLLLAAIGPILMAVGAAITGFTALIPVFTAVGTAVAFLLSPVGLVVAAVGALVAVWVLFGDDITRIVTSTYQTVKTWLWDKLEPVLTPVIALVKSIAAMWDVAYKLIAAILPRLVSAVSGMVMSVVGWIVGKLEPVWRPVIEAVTFVASVFVAVKDRVVEVVRMMYENIKAWLLDKFTAVVDGIRAKVEMVTGFFSNMYAKITGNQPSEPLAQLSTSIGVVASHAASLPAPTTAAAAALDKLGKSTGGVVAPSEDAVKAAKKLNDELKSMVATLNGSALQADVDKLGKAIAMMGGAANISAYQKKLLGEQLSEMASQGALLSPELHKIWLEYQKLNPAIKVVTAGMSGFLNVLDAVPGRALSAVKGLAPLPGALAKATLVNPWEMLAGFNKLPGVITTLAKAPAMAFKTKFQEHLTVDLPQAIVGAIQGGGSVIEAAGSSIGGFLMSDKGIGKSITKGAKALFGDKLGAAIGSALPGLGAMVGPMVSAVFGKIFGSAGRDSVKSFAATMGGFDALREKLLPLGAEGERLWKALTQGVGKNNPEQAAKAIKAIETALADAAEKTRELEAEIGNVTDQLADLKSQSEPTWKDMIAAADEFGISVNALGPAFQQQRLTEQATEIWNAFDTLKRGGADVGAVLAGMSDEASAFVQESLKFGTLVPENMREMLQGMVDAGTLLDENGDKITDLTGIEFGPAVKSQWEIVADSIKELSGVLDKLAAQLRGDVVDAVGSVVGAFRGIPSQLDIDVRTNGGGGRDSSESGLPGFSGGTQGRYLNFGQGTLAMLHGRERVMTENEARNGKTGGNLILKVGERELGRVALRAISEATGEYGVGIG